MYTGLFPIITVVSIEKCWFPLLCIIVGIIYGTHACKMIFWVIIRILARGWQMWCHHIHIIIVNSKNYLRAGELVDRATGNCNRLDYPVELREWQSDDWSADFLYPQGDAMQSQAPGWLGKGCHKVWIDHERSPNKYLQHLLIGYTWSSCVNRGESGRSAG